MFEIFSGKNGQFYFRLKAGNGEVIGVSEGYTTKQSAQNGIESVRINSTSRNLYTVWQSSNNSQWYFNLKSEGNGQIILQSEGYVSKQGANAGVDSVEVNAPKAVISDLT